MKFQTAFFMFGK